MGTANKQIATRANVNSKRLGAFVTSTSGGTYMKKCVTKKAVTDIEYLNVNNRVTTTTLNPTEVNSYFGNSSPTISMNIQQSGTYNANITSSNITVDTLGYNIYCLMYANVYNASNYATVNYSAPYTSSTQNIKYYALYKRTLTVPTNCSLTLNIQSAIRGATSDSSSGLGGVHYYDVNSVTWYPGIWITNSDDSYTIASMLPAYETSDSFTDSIVFSSSYSTINVYFVISSMRLSFMPLNGDSYAGFMVNCQMTLTYNDSYYDQTYKLAQYQDINRIGGTFPCACYIYNNKSSSAKLDYVKARVSLTSTVGKGTWTDIGSVDPGTVDSTWTGIITCTLPTSIDLSKQYYLYVECGYTNLNQNWYGGWGNPGANYNASTSCGKQTWGYTPVVPLNSATGAAQTVLNYTAINSTSGASAGVLSGGLQGRTSTRTALFRIE